MFPSGVSIKAVTRYGATWSYYKNNPNATFNKIQMELVINHHLDQCLFGVCCLTGRILIEISMESDYPSLVAKLFIYFYGNKW